MSLTQSMKIANAHINNAQLNISDAMQAQNSDPRYSLQLAIGELEEAIDNLRTAEKER